MSSTKEEKPQLVKEGKRVLKLKEKQRLTLPVFSLAHTPIMIIKALEDPHEADFVVEIEGKKDSKPTILTVLNVDTNEVGHLICNTIMLSAFQRSGYPLTGKYFKLTGGDIREGKRYRTVDVMEMAVSEEE
jgi:hypothetical protein